MLNDDKLLKSCFKRYWAVRNGDGLWVTLAKNGNGTVTVTGR
jgi:hypothetical protein